MSQQFPGPTPHQQPQAPYSQPYPGGQFPAPQPPKKRMSGWAIAGIVIGGVFVLMIALGAIVGPKDTGSSSDGKPARDTAAAAPAPAEKTGAQPAVEPAKPKPAPASPVKVTAKKTAFSKSILAEGSDYTSVKVTIANNSSKDIDVNPLYFAITDTDGSKHTAELAVDENQIDTVQLAPGEKITGTVTGKGDFTPKYVTFSEGLFGDGIRADVS